MAYRFYNLKLEKGMYGQVGKSFTQVLESEDPDLNKCVLIETPPRENLIINPHSGYWSDTSDYLVRKYSMENALNYYYGRYDEVKVIRNGVKA